MDESAATASGAVVWMIFWTGSTSYTSSTPYPARNCSFPMCPPMPRLYSVASTLHEQLFVVKDARDRH